MRCIALLSLAALFVASGAQAAVSAQLSAQDIDELEAVRLIIKASETRQAESLNLEALEKDFHVMGTNTSSQYRFINGREQSWVDYQINLQPKRTGTLVIPPIRVGNDVTPSLTLRVRPLSDATRRQIDDLVFFENELSSRSVYVQSQLVLTRRLLYANGVQLYSDLPGAPEIPDAVVLVLGETSTGSTLRQGRSYGVLEQRYAIFPETSGELDIPGISVTASVQMVDGGRRSRKGVRVSTPDETVTVRPVPAAFPVDQPWLPAMNVELHQELTPRTGHMVGDTLTHELLVHITGNLGSAAAPQPLELDDVAFRQYPQAPVINDDTNAARVMGSRLQTTSVVPLAPGPSELPGQTIYWWDTEADELRVSTTPPLRLRVGGTAAVTPQDNTTEASVPPSATPRATRETGTALGAVVNALVQFLTASTTLVYGAIALLIAIAASLLWRSRWLHDLWARRVQRADAQAIAPGRLAEVFADPAPRTQHTRLGRYLADVLRTQPADARIRFAAAFPEAAPLLRRLEAAAFGDPATLAPGDDALAADEQRRLQRLLAQAGRSSQRSVSAVRDPLPPLFAHETP